MNYSVSLTIPASTAEASKVKEEFRLPRGIITAGAVFFPDGCNGLAHVVVYLYEHQLYPTHAEQSYTGGGILIEFPADYELPKEWNLFSARGWNEDTVNDHTPIVYLTVLLHPPEPTDLLSKYPKLAQFLDALRGN